MKPGPVAAPPTTNVEVPSMLMVPRLFTEEGDAAMVTVDPFFTTTVPLLTSPAVAVSTSVGPFTLIWPVAVFVNRLEKDIVFPPVPPNPEVDRIPLFVVAPVTFRLLAFSRSTCPSLSRVPVKVEDDPPVPANNAPLLLVTLPPTVAMSPAFSTPNLPLFVRLPVM